MPDSRSPDPDLYASSAAIIPPMPRPPHSALLVLALGCGASGASTGGTTAPPARTALAPRPFVSPYAYEHFVRAELAHARGQHAAAAEEYRMALTSGDDDPYLFARLAEACEAAGEAACADDALDDALELDPQSEAAWLARGRIAERRNRLDDAIAAYERAESTTGAPTEATSRLAALLRARGLPERALAVLERASRRGPEDARRALHARLELALARGDGDALQRAAADALAHGAGDAELLRRTATELLRSGRASLAARVLAVVQPSELDGRLRLELALARADRAEAERLLLETPASWLGGSLAVAQTYVALGLWSQARARLDEQDGAVPDDEALRALLFGQCLLGLGQPGEAAGHFARVPAGSAHHAAANAGLAQALGAAGLAALAAEVAPP
jgi:predicted Zn-dependent protease